MAQIDNPREFFANLPAFNPRKWVEGKIKDPVKKEIAMGAVDAFENLIARENIKIEDLAPILKAVQDKSRVVADVGAWRLLDLAENHKIVLDALRSLFTSKKASERWRVIAYLRSTLPRDFLIDIVSKGLTDKSSAVRLIAADACVGIGLKELLPLVENLLFIERDVNLQDVKSYIGLLKDGHHLHYSSNGHPLLTIKDAWGVVKTIFLKQERIDKEGLETIIEKEKIVDNFYLTKSIQPTATLSGDFFVRIICFPKR